MADYVYDRCLTNGEIEAKRLELMALPENWDSYGGRPIDPRAISAVEKLLKSKPYLVPRSDGGVQVEWGDFEVAVLPGGEQDFEWAAEVERLLKREQELLAACNRELEARRAAEGEARQSRCDGLLWRNEVERLRELLGIAVSHLDALARESAPAFLADVQRLRSGMYPVAGMASASEMILEFCRTVKSGYRPSFRSTATFTIADLERYAEAIGVGDVELAKAICLGDTFVRELQEKRAAVAAGSGAV